MKYLNKTFSLLLLTLFFSSHFLYSEPALSALSQLRSDAEVVFSAEDSRELDQQIPKTLQKLLVDETIKNPYFYGDESRIVESGVTRRERLDDVDSLIRLGQYDPRQGLWFYLPHLEIPMEHFDNLNISPSLSEEMKRLYFFTRGGKRYVRYFLHPFRELQNYHDLIKKYELKYTYIARPISSPRSMIIFKENDPESASWVKVSLGLTMSALQRRQKPEKLARALMVNEGLELIPQDTRKKLKLSWLNESFAAQLPGKEEVIIGRDVREFHEMEGSSKKLRPTFSFFHSPDGKQEPDIKALIKKSGLREVDFFKKYFLEPAIKNFIYLAFEEGIQWSMHTGNYYTEVSANGIPTGKISIKDFDGAAFDPEMRMLRGKPFHGIHQMSEHPFADAWFAAASGRGTSERQRLGYVYSLYIRDVYGFNSIGSYMFSYLLKWGNMKNKSRQEVRRVVEDAIDEMTMDLIAEHTGIQVRKSSLGRGTGVNAGINMAYNEWRNINQQQFLRSDASENHQTLLRNEFIRLMKHNRSWANFSRSNVAAAKDRLHNDNVVFFYHEHAGLIQARSYAGKNSENYTIIGYALIEDPAHSDAQKKFLHSIGAKRPAKEALEVDLSEILKNKGKEKAKSKTCKTLISWLESQRQNLRRQMRGWADTPIFNTETLLA